MDLNDFFDPVELDKPSDYIEPEDSAFGKNIFIHTPNNKIPKSLALYKLAIFGVPEDRNSRNTGSAQAPDRIRTKLYQLTSITNSGIKIIDLGNLKTNSDFTDTYYGVQGVLLELFKENIIALMLGGTQDLTYGTYLAFKHENEMLNLVSIDSRIDMLPNSDSFNSETYLSNIVYDKSTVFSFCNIAHQSHYVDEKKLAVLNKLYYQFFRLGEIIRDINACEPYLRDAGCCMFDIGAIQQSDAPGNRRPSPNGLTGMQACQLARYAGMSERLKIFGICEVNPLIDLNNHTSHQAAQIAWYFIEGVANRWNEFPNQEDESFKKFIVTLEKLNHDLAFYKSAVSDRWWIEVPSADEVEPKKLIVACSAQDYELACKNEIPDCWWKTFQKLK
jgi:formiminoglutamase